MFLSKLFKHTRAKVMMALAGLTMVLGVGAAISVAVTQTQNEVVETKAEAVSGTSNLIRILAEASSSSGKYANGNAKTQISVWDDGGQTYTSATSSWFGAASQNNWNTVSLNGTTSYWYQEIDLEQRNWLDSHGITIKRANPSDLAQWNYCNISADSGTLSRKWNAGTSNSALLGNPSGATFTATDKGLIYRIRLMHKASGTGDYTQYECYLYDSAHTLTLPTPTAPSGYSFGGWFTTSACTVSAGTSIKPTADTQLYAKYTALTSYTVKTWTKYGSSAASEHGSTTKYSGQTFTVPAIPTVSQFGYVAPAKWYTNPDGTSGDSYSPGASITVTGNINLYAVYTAASTKTLYFDAGSVYGSYSAPKIYAWDTGGNNGAFPGAAMTKVSETKKSIYGGYVWTATIPSTATVIFSNGASDTQTGNLSLASVASGQTYLLYEAKNGNWQNSRTLSLVNQDTSTTNHYYIYSGVNFTMPSLSKEGYTAKWNTNPAGDGTDYNPGGTYSFTATTTTLYSKFNILNYTINYYYVIDGVLQDTRYYSNADSLWHDGYMSGSTSADHGTLFGNLPEPSVYGCSFDGWFSDSACTIGLSGTAISQNYAAGSVYAKFTSDSSSATYYIGINGATEQNKYLLRSWDPSSPGYTWIWYENADESIKTSIKLQEMTAISVIGWKYFAFRLPAEVNAAVICKGQWGTDKDGYQAQTIDLHPGSGTDGENDSYANGHNLFIVGDTQTANAKRKGSWVDIQYYLEVCSDNTYSSGKTTALSMSSPSSGNTAEIMEASIPAGSFVRGKYVIDGTSGYNVTYGGDNSKRKNSSDVIIHYAVDAGSSLGVYFKQSTDSGSEGEDWYVGSGTYNVYINSAGAIYIVDCAGIDAGGYLYVVSDLSASELKVDSSIDSTSYYSHAKLSSVTDVAEASNVCFGGVLGVIKVPVYNLHKGNGATDKTITLTLTSAANSSKTTEVTGLTVSSAETDYMITLDSSSSWSESTAVSTENVTALETAYAIGRAIATAPSSSVCNIQEDTAQALCDLYDVAATKALLESDPNDYGIQSWDGDNTTSRGSPSYTGSAHAQFSYVRYELGQRAGEGYKTSYPYSGVFYPGAHTSDQSPLTTTLWVVLGCGLLGLGAIGTAYFVSKKKKHQA